MQRVKTKKKKHEKPETDKDFIVYALMLMLSASVATLASEMFRFTEEQLAEYMEGVSAGIEEVHDNRTSLWQYVRDVKALTGIDVKKICEELWYGESR